MDLEKNVETFLKQTQPFKKKLLLAFSGGEDSLALAHCFYRMPVVFELAHFDHGWRMTSAKEAEELEAWAKERTIPFHIKKSACVRNSELAAREERYAFFEQLFSEGSYAALVLAHHKQDQAETILKRVLEGTHLTTLKGMQPISMRGNMSIWRPLLSVSKDCILSYITRHHLSPISDSTNLDPQYLRGKMRTSLFPKLSKEYGKEITDPLIRLGSYAKDLEDYLEENTIKTSPVTGPIGTMWDFQSAHPFEVTYVLSRFFRDRGFMPSHHILGQIVNALQQHRANFQITFANQMLIVDRGRIFWICHSVPQFPCVVKLEDQTLQSGKWTWKIHFSESKNYAGWEEWWKGKISLTLPKGEYRLEPNCGAYSKISNSCKIPAFLRPSFPILTERGRPIKKFLTGRGCCEPIDEQNSLTLSLELKMEV